MMEHFRFGIVERLSTPTEFPAKTEMNFFWGKPTERNNAVGIEIYFIVWPLVLQLNLNKSKMIL